MAKSIEQIYTEWRGTIKKPDDTIFYYTKSLDHIILGLAMYEIISRTLRRQLKKGKEIRLYSNYINEMVTAWIDDDAVAFEYTFTMLIPLCEAYIYVFQGLEEKHPGYRKIYRNLLSTFYYWVPMGCIIDDTNLNTLLDDITTDGETIYSDKIAQMGKRAQPTVLSKGKDMSELEALELFEKCL